MSKSGPSPLPNLVSFVRIALGVSGASFLWQSSQAATESVAIVWATVSFACLLIGAVTDWLDGFLARRLGAETEFGAFIDPVADKVLTGSYLVVYCIITEFDLWLIVPVFIIVGRDLVVTVLRLIRPHSAQLKVSLEAKFKTASLMILVMAPFVLIASGLRDIGAWYFYWLGGIWFIAILSGWTAMRYLR